MTVNIYKQSNDLSTQNSKFLYVLPIYKVFPLPNHHTMKYIYGGMEIKLPTFLPLVLDGGKWSASHWQL